MAEKSCCDGIAYEPDSGADIYPDRDLVELRTAADKQTSFRRKRSVLDRTRL